MFHYSDTQTPYIETQQSNGYPSAKRPISKHKNGPAKIGRTTNQAEPAESNSAMVDSNRAVVPRWAKKRQRGIKNCGLLQITSNIGLRGLITTTSYAATNGIIHTNNLDIFGTALPQSASLQ